MAETVDQGFGCWIVYCLHCEWLSDTCRDVETLVAAHKIHTEHLLGLVGENRELTVGEMAPHLPEPQRALYYDRAITRYFDLDLSAASS